MFKKIEIWVLYLTILISILFAVSFGILVRQELAGSTKLGWISKTALYIAELPIQLRRAFYGLKLEDRFSNLDGFNGNPNHEETYLLLSRYDGNLKEGIIELIDLRNFESLHTWNPDIDAFNLMVDKIDEFEHLERDHNNQRKVLMHPNLTSNGELLFGWDSPLRKIDSCSNLVFQIAHSRFHHSIETDTDGNIWLPSRIFPQSLPIEKVGSEYEDFGDDSIVKLSSKGDVLFEKSVNQIFIANGLEYLLFSVGNRQFNNDPIHLNDIQPVNLDGKFWKKGDVFLSLRHQSMIILYRPSTNKIIWKGTGPFFHQHDVDILDDHRISIFNNNSKDFINGDFVDGHNEVIIYNFETNKYSSYLKNSLVEHEVKTITEGLAQILNNGDLFVEESNYGRSLYFKSDGTLSWSHVNRANDGNIYAVGWSRILYTDEDIQKVNNFLTNRGTCNE